MGKGKPPIYLLLSILHNFSIDHNSNSPILHHYATYLPQLVAQACPHVATDPIGHFIFLASIKSARDYIRQEASHLRRTKLNSIASPDLCTQLSEILIAPMSFPLISMSRSVKHHRHPNDIFLIALKQKLFLDIYPATNLPTCVCGSAIDPKGQHVFNCRHVSKWASENCLIHIAKYSFFIAATLRFLYP
jgi:hypothetical protein